MSANRILIVLLGLFGSLNGILVSHAQETSTITTVNKVRALTPEQAGHKLPVRIHGVVTVLSGWKSSFFFQDSTAGISVDRTTDSAQLEAGQEVEISGVTGAGLFAPIILASDVKVLGKGEFPRTRLFDFSELAGGQQDSQWIGVRGVVRSATVRPSWGRSALFLTIDIGRGNLITARVHDFPGSGFENLVAAGVYLRGVCATEFNDKRQFVGLRLFVQNLADLHIEEPAPAQPFNGPTTPPSRLLQFSNHEGVTGIRRVKVRGTLIYQDVGHGLYIQSGPDGVFAHSKQTTTVPIGSELEVLGYPAVGSYSPVLDDAVFRSTGNNIPIASKPMRASDAIVVRDGFSSAPYDATLVQVRGRLIEHLVSSDEDVLLLRDGDSILTVRLRNRQEGTRFSPPEGTLLGVTGVCNARLDENHEPRSFEILPRSPADVVVLEKVSWWTRTHLIWTIALLGLLATTVVGCMTIVHREQWSRQMEKSNVQLTKEILAREQTQQELQRKTDELSLSNKDLDQFAFAASHDLQEPLRMIASYVQLLGSRYKDKLDSDANDFINFAVDGAERMQVLIRDLLAFSGINSKKRPLTIIKLNEILDMAVRNLSLAIAESGAKIEIDPLPEVLGDPSLLTQLFQNLLGNAIKYRGECPLLIHVALEPQMGEWLVHVIDNGIGFESRDAERIFLIFQRLHTRQEYSGTGIGLALCKRIVEHSGGRIWATSTPRKGSSFHVAFPRVPSEICLEDDLVLHTIPS
jgi:signal transduction histidine kinase